MVSFLIILLLILISNGPNAAFVVLSETANIIKEIFIGIFPVFVPAFTQAIEDYLTSAYFIVGVIIALASSAGIVLSIKERKVLYALISIIVNAISLFSIISNLAKCA